MKVTFPHMGNLHIALKAVLEGLELEVISPPPISKRTFELGVKNSPEFACLPLKINMGNFIEALEKGADTIIMAGGWGPCRFGYYAQVERDILQDLGYDFQMIILEAPDSRLSELWKQLKSLGENVSMWQCFQALKLAWEKLNALEIMDKKLEYSLPRVRDKDQCELLYQEALVGIEAAANKTETQEITQAALKKIDNLDYKDIRPVRVGLVGEIYTVLEPAANFDICRLLGRMDVEVRKSIYLTEWINDHLLGGLVKASSHQRIVASAKPYLNYGVGGHGLETIGATVDFAKQKYDGVIQIGPLTCMPEIVAQTILPSVSQQEGIPCMTLWFDEHSGTAGINTRLEAFVDMVRRQNFNLSKNIKEA